MIREFKRFLEQPLSGYNLRGWNFDQTLKTIGEPMLVVFLRNSDDPITSNTLAEIKGNLGPSSIPMVIILKDSYSGIDKVVKKNNAGDVAFALDLDGTLAHLGGICRASRKERWGWRTFLALLKALSRGHGVGKDWAISRRLEHWFLIDSGGVIWEHRAKYAGVLPEWQQIIQVFEGYRKNVLRKQASGEHSAPLSPASNP